MNNAITEINTLEGTNSRITEAEDRISEVEDRMVEINESERIKEKRIKRNEDLPPIPPSIRVFSIESTLCIRWPKSWSFSFSIIPSKEIPGQSSFRME